MRHRGGPARIPYGPHRFQVGDLWRPRAPSPGDAVPLVVLFHGGYWRPVFTRRLMDRLAADVAAHGWAAWNVEYRRPGVGGGGGGWPRTFEDASAALEAVAAIEGIDASRVVTCGHSVGGHLALWTAAAAARARAHEAPHDGTPSGSARSRRVVPALAVSLAGVVDLVAAAHEGLGRNAVQRVMGGDPEALVDEYRCVSLPAALPLGVPQLVIHGTEDTVVPLRMGAIYADAAREAGDAVSFVAIEHADHMSMIDPRAPAWGAAVATIAEHLA